MGNCISSKTKPKDKVFHPIRGEAQEDFDVYYKIRTQHVVESNLGPFKSPRKPCCQKIPALPDVTSPSKSNQENYDFKIYETPPYLLRNRNVPKPASSNPDVVPKEISLYPKLNELDKEIYDTPKSRFSRDVEPGIKYQPAKGTPLPRFSSFHKQKVPRFEVFESDLNDVDQKPDVEPEIKSHPAAISTLLPTISSFYQHDAPKLEIFESDLNDVEQKPEIKPTILKDVEPEIKYHPANGTPLPTISSFYQHKVPNLDIFEANSKDVEQKSKIKTTILKDVEPEIKYLPANSTPLPTISSFYQLNVPKSENFEADPKDVEQKSEIKTTIFEDVEQKPEIKTTFQKDLDIDSRSIKPKLPEIHGVLRVKKIGTIDIPKILLQKHFVTAPVTGEKAMSISDHRDNYWVKFNTVFEKPGRLIACQVLDGHLKKYQGSIIHITEKKMKAFQCRQKRNGDWIPDRLGAKFGFFASEEEHYHMIKACLRFEKVIIENDSEE